MWAGRERASASRSPSAHPWPARPSFRRPSACRAWGLPMLAGDFVKGHGLGNDYIVVDGARFGISLTPERVRLLCHRNLGLGSDGVLEVQSRLDGFHARIWNPDGSEAERSGNGLRIVAKFLSDHGYTAEGSFVISTIAGPVAAQVMKRAGRVHSVRLEMGRSTIDRARKGLDAGG